MKTLFLHIGTPKTATSSIQKFCAKNREVLQSKGYCYPYTIRNYPGIGENRNAHFMMGKIPSEEDSSVPNSEEQRFFELGMEHVHACFESFDNVILSDEGLWMASGRARPNLWKDLKADADKYGYTIKIIVYLRRQDQFLSSRYNQRVKNTGYTKTWEEHVKKAPAALGDILDYAAKIRGIAEVFGREQLYVRRFDKSGFYGGSIYADFFQCLSLTITEEYQELEQDANLSFGGNTFEIMRVINKMPDLDKSNQSYLRQQIKKCAEESAKCYKYTMFSKEEAETFLSHYRQGNEQIAADYIGDGKPLFDYEVKSTEKWNKQNEYMIDDLIRLFAVTTCQLHEEILKLKEENARQKAQLLRQQAGLLQKIKRRIRV